MTPTPIPTTDLTITRTINAAPETIYDIWLDPKNPGGPWFGADRAIVNAHVDGLFFHAATHAGRTWAHYGRFIALERGKRIEHTWMSEATKGLESVVTITLTAKGGKTELVLHHAGVPDDDFGRQHAEGWGWMADMLVQKFAAKA